MVTLKVGSWVNVASYATPNSSGTIYYDVYLNSQSVANNTSSFQTRLRHAIATGSGWACYNREFSGSYLTTVTGTDYYCNGAYNGNYSPTYTTGSGSVTHNSDGTKTVNITAKVSFTSISQVYNLSGSMTFPTIARASKPTTNVSSIVVNGSNSITINTNRASSSFTHTLEFKIGSTSITSANNVGASYSYTPALSIFNSVTNSKTATVTVNCTTYSGSTQIGSVQTTTFTITANEASYKPTLGTPTCTEGNSSIGVSSWNTVRYLSSKTLTIAVTTKNSATVSSVYAIVGGVRHKMTLSSGNYQVVLSNITTGSTSSTIIYKFEATDSRGFTTTTGEYSGTFYPYSYPQITDLTVARSSATSTNGTLTIKGTYYYATSPKTSTSIYYAYASGSMPADSAVTTALSTSSSSFTISVSLTGLTTTSQFTYYVKIKDAFGKYASRNVVLAISKGALWVGKNTVRTLDMIVEGGLKVEGGSFVHCSQGTTGTAGYVKLARIVIAGTYTNNEPITFVLQHLQHSPTTVTVCFDNVNDTDPAMTVFEHNGPDVAYIVKATTSTWDLYVKKNTNYDEVNVMDCYYSRWLMNKSSLTWTSEHVSSLPSGYQTSTHYGYPASVITSGTFAADRIPSLAASKITSGTIAAARISGNFTRTDSSYKFPDGTMIQWGSMSVPNNSTQTVSFPTAFGTSCLAMWATCNQVGFGTYSTIAVKASSKSQFKISQYNAASASMTVEWFAIGY